MGGTKDRGLVLQLGADNQAQQTRCFQCWVSYPSAKRHVVMAAVSRRVQLPEPWRTALKSDLDTNDCCGHLTTPSLRHLVMLRAPNSLEQYSGVCLLNYTFNGSCSHVQAADVVPLTPFPCFRPMRGFLCPASPTSQFPLPLPARPLAAHRPLTFCPSSTPSCEGSFLPPRECSTALTSEANITPNETLLSLALPHLTAPH